MVEHVAKAFPHLRILARAHDRHHVYELENAGAHAVEREMFEGAVAMGRSALRELGQHPFRAETKTRAFRRHDNATIEMLRAHWNESGVDGTYIDAARAQNDTLFEVMSTDRADNHERKERGWNPPPKGDADA